MAKLLGFLLILYALPAAASPDEVATNNNESAMSVFSRSHAVLIENLTALTGSTDRVIQVTSHTAKVGDILRFTDATANYYVERHVQKVTPTTITITKPADSAPSNGEHFTVFRLATPLITSSGEITVEAKPYAYTYSTSHVHAYSSVNVTSGAWVELIAALPSEVHGFYLWDSSGVSMELGVGAEGEEERIMLDFPGGPESLVPEKIAANARLSVRALGATATAGELIFVGLQ